MSLWYDGLLELIQSSKNPISEQRIFVHYECAGTSKKQKRFRRAIRARIRGWVHGGKVVEIIRHGETCYGDGNGRIDAERD